MEDEILTHHNSLRACVNALDNVSIMPYEEEKKISTHFYQRCPFSASGKVDWIKFEKKINIGENPESIIAALEDLLENRFDATVYIEWDTHIPFIKTTLTDIVKNFDAVFDVSPRKFIFNLSSNYVVEILQNGQITAGIFPTSDKFFQKETYINPRILEEDQVFKECVDSLKTSLLPVDEEKRLDDWFKKNCPITKWGRVDWQQFTKQERVGYEIKEMKRALTKLLGMKGPYDMTAYIEWSEVGMPVIKTSLGDIIGNFADIEPVSFEKFIFNPQLGYVIEILHSHEMTMGIVPGFER